MTATLRAHQSMALLRCLGEQVAELRRGEEAVGSVHLAMGQEAIPVGTCAALRPDDALISTYRGHNWAVSKGAEPEAVIAELLGRSGGTNGGRAGSALISAPEHDFVGENSIVGAGAPVALGVALAFRRTGAERVAVTVFGDGAMNQGSVSEAFNFAAAFALPLIFICENNGLSEHSRIEEMVGQAELYRRPEAFGIPSFRVDGNDPAAVQQAVAAAADRARRGEGPTFIEAITERLSGHNVGDLERYRRDGELEAARTREPLVLSRARLLEQGVTEPEIGAAEARARQTIAEATERARKQPLADASTVGDHVYVAA